MIRLAVICSLAATCLMALISCASDKTPVTEPPDAGPGGVDAGPPKWRTVIEGLDGSLLSIWGASDKDVWAVGGPLGNAGYESLVVRFDGATWRRVKPGKAESFWWVHGSSANDVWLVGEKGRITRWDGAQFSEMTSGTDATLFGVWAAAPNDVWAVGGTPDQPTKSNDVVLHYDGTSWKPEALPSTDKASLFKVWGSSKEDIYIVGELGIIWHRSPSTGGVWKREGEGIAKTRLTTVAGCSATEVYAVGGRDVLVSNGNGSWSREAIDELKLVNDVNGVSCTGRPGEVVIVGGGSLKFRRVKGVWESDFGSNPYTDLHGAWADPTTGAFWGVGGQFIAAPTPNAKRQGVVGRYSSDVVSSVLIP